jgi:hypothetical protein
MVKEAASDGRRSVTLGIQLGRKVERFCDRYARPRYDRTFQRTALLTDDLSPTPREYFANNGHDRCGTDNVSCMGLDA